MRIGFLPFLFLAVFCVSSCHKQSADLEPQQQSSNLDLAVITLEFDVDANGKAQNIRIVNATHPKDEELGAAVIREHVFEPKYRNRRITAPVTFVIHADGSRTDVGIVDDDDYFPPEMLRGNYQGWFSKFLAAMKEPKLASLAKDRDIFVLRVLDLPSFQHPVAVRIEKKGDSITRRAVVLSGAGGYEPGDIKMEKTDTMSVADYEELLDSLEKSGFWKLAPNDDEIGFDGSELIIETVRNGKYAVFVRWTPEARAKERGLTKLNEVIARLFKTAGVNEAIQQTPTQ